MRASAPKSLRAERRGNLQPAGGFRGRPETRKTMLLDIGGSRERRLETNLNGRQAVGRTVKNSQKASTSRTAMTAENQSPSFTGGFAEVIRGSFWIVLGSVVVNAGGLVFWLLSGRIGGVEAVGYATGAFSIATMLSSFGNLGLNYAVLREVPLKGARAYSAALVLALVLGFSIASFSTLFSGMYGGIASYIPLIYLLTVSNLVVAVSTSTLMAALKAKHVFTVNSLATVVKVLAGISLLLLGLGGYGLVLGILSAQLTALVASTTLALVAVGFSTPKLEDIVEAFKIGTSNYPQILSTQLVVSAGIVLIALLTGSPEYTGVFYIALMIALALSIIPGSMASMSLPVMVKNRHYEIADESLRIGSAIVLPLALAVGIASKEILRLINPEFTAGALTLTVLTLTVIPQAVVLNGISKLNSKKDLKGVLKVGIVRLTTLTVLIYLLTPATGILGAAIAYLVSTLTPVPLLTNELYVKEPSKLLLIQVLLLLLLLPLAKPLGTPTVVLLGVAFSLAILYVTRTLRLGEIAELVKVIIGSVK